LYIPSSPSFPSTHQIILSCFIFNFGFEASFLSLFEVLILYILSSISQKLKVSSFWIEYHPISTWVLFVEWRYWLFQSNEAIFPFIHAWFYRGDSLLLFKPKRAKRFVCLIDSIKSLEVWWIITHHYLLDLTSAKKKSMIQQVFLCLQCCFSNKTVEIWASSSRTMGLTQILWHGNFQYKLIIQNDFPRKIFGKFWHWFYP